MESQAENYEEYFLFKFKNLFETFINDSILNITDDKIKKNLNDILQILNKLDYSKIMIKYAKNEELYFNLKNFNIDNKNVNIKLWNLMPKINLYYIILNYDSNNRKKLLSLLDMMYCSSISYLKVIETTDEDGFNPYKIVGEYSKHLSVDEMYEGVEIKKPDTYEFLMNQILENFNLNDNLKNVNSTNIDDATKNINTFLDNSNDNASSNVIASMLSGIKEEILNLKNDTTANDNGEGIKKIFNIAKRISEKSFNNIDKKNVNPLQLWDLTTQLAVSTTKSDAIEIFGDVVRNQIIDKMKEVNKN